MFDVLASTRSLLESALGVPCSTQVPRERPPEFVTIERTGGGYSVGRDAPMMAVQAWAGTEAEAYALALMAREALLSMREEVPEVCSCRVGSIYAFPDPDSMMRRYQIDFYAVTRP